MPKVPQSGGKREESKQPRRNALESSNRNQSKWKVATSPNQVAKWYAGVCEEPRQTHQAKTLSLKVSSRRLGHKCGDQLPLRHRLCLQRLRKSIKHSLPINISTAIFTALQMTFVEAGFGKGVSGIGL